MRFNRNASQLAAALVGLLACSLPALAQSGGNFDLTWNTIDGGGGASATGVFSVSGTIGQLDAGQMSGGAFSLAGGFWAGMVPNLPPCGSADFNCDGDTGTDQDIEAFFACLAGNCPPPPCTSTADFNGDGDVGTDQDIEAFFRVLAGGAC